MNKHVREHNGNLSKPLVIRLFEDQRQRLDEFVKDENKRLVNEGLPPKNSSEYVRQIFEAGLKAVQKS
ncbi:MULTISPECIES: hypothetical protein [Roseivirga]|jgi:hypothetical protein|uniref:hypothetical protein n=1 Tax=Roseivirga TaxID=290180 RepID=UPI00257BB80C|nr:MULTISPECIES: hypothetical protein [Roseivirga]MEC7755704.1 hypothetical protein [Bacteroidota bacterium]|tara:strand:- start:246 stop:449 length:204 start_codon:yes stop_codon:yes gene_type:complete